MNDRTDPPFPLLVTSRAEDETRWLTCPHGLAGARCCLKCWNAGVASAVKTALGDCQREIQQLKSDLREYLQADLMRE